MKPARSKLKFSNLKVISLFRQEARQTTTSFYETGHRPTIHSPGIRKSSLFSAIAFLIWLVAIGQNFFLEKNSFYSSKIEESNDQIQLTTPSGQKLKLEARAFQPGEMVLATLEGRARIERAWVAYNGHKFYFTPISSVSDQIYYAFIGLDGELRPGEHIFRFIVQREDKSWEKAEFPINLRAREFRTRKLKVAPQYIEPPIEMRERIEREAELIGIVLSMVTPEWLGNGSFIWPHWGRITAYFGDQRLYNNRRTSFHNGIDIAAAQGEPVVASNSGLVRLASNFYFSGKMVIIDHGLGLFTAYHHLDKILVRREQKVNKGEVIGLAGNSGLSTGSHLHWSVRVGRSRIDPMSLLSLSFPEKK